MLFESRKFGAIGLVRNRRANFYLMTMRLHTMQSIFDVTNLDQLLSVGMAYFNVDSNPDILPSLATQHDGLVIVTARDGQLSKRYLQCIETFLTQGYPFILSTRVFFR